MATSKIPHVLVITGLGVTALGVTLYIYQRKREKAEEEKKKAETQAQQTAQASAAPTGQPKIPLTVFADEGIPREATRP